MCLLPRDIVSESGDAFFAAALVCKDGDFALLVVIKPIDRDSLWLGPVACCKNILAIG